MENFIAPSILQHKTKCKNYIPAASAGAFEHIRRFTHIFCHPLKGLCSCEKKFENLSADVKNVPLNGVAGGGGSKLWEL